MQTLNLAWLNLQSFELQSLVVALLVTGSVVYAVWKLMPLAARRASATALLRLPMPAAFEGPLRRVAQAPSGCGCDGCDRAPIKAQPRNASQAIKFHPRPPR